MKPLFLTITTLVSLNSLVGQTDTVFFNSEWKKCEKQEAKFYRTVVKNKDLYIISDMFMNNNPQMIAVCSNSISPLNKNGSCIYFDEKGKKESHGSFRDNKPTGTWIWYDNNGNDSTVATYREDGTKNYTRFSKIELEKQKASSDVFTLTDEMPSFPGGQNEMFSFISKEFKIPKVDSENGTKGTFYTSIIVNEDGSISILEIKRSLSTTLDEEAKRVIKKMPTWSPGKINGKAVKVKLTIPFKVI